jgi:hypothetical protein
MDWDTIVLSFWKKMFEILQQMFDVLNIVYYLLAIFVIHLKS